MRLRRLRTAFLPFIAALLLGFAAVTAGLDEAAWAASSPPRPPLLVVAGASFTAGVGARCHSEAWPYLLANRLHWRVVVDGVPGAGYVRPGFDARGPIARLIDRLQLRRLHPRLVIIQAGHNDIGEPLPLLRRRVRQAVDDVADAVPRATIVVMTVFTRADASGPAAWATDRAIVSSARESDHRVVVIDPLAGHWRFPRSIRGGLHPSAAGYRWIAARVANDLRSDVTVFRAGGWRLAACRGTPPRHAWRGRPAKARAPGSLDRIAVSAVASPKTTIAAPRVTTGQGITFVRRPHPSHVTAVSTSTWLK